MAHKSDSYHSTVELKKLKSITITVEENPSLSKNINEEVTAKDSSSDFKHDPSPQDNHKTAYTDDTIEVAIKTGDVEAVTGWLATLPTGDEGRIEVNKVKYKYPWDVHCTALHLAALSNQVAVAKKLLENGADPNKNDSRNWNALHAACRGLSDVDVTEMMKILIERKCNINEENEDQRTPLHLAAENNHPEAVRILLDNNVDVEKKDVWGNQPIHLAVREGNQEVVEALVKCGAVDSKALENALRKGYEEIAKQLIKTPKWPLLMRHTFNMNEQGEDDQVKTTPFREMVRKMPAVAEEILNKCTVNDPDVQNFDDEFYSVAFNYEFVEDTRDKGERNDESASSRVGRDCQKDDEHEYGCDYRSIVFNGFFPRERNNYTTSWGPVGFKKENHPLAVMVKYKRLKLLTHPLVGSLLHHKWNKFGQLGYFLNLLTYCVFFIFLTIFAFIIENPRSQACLIVSVNVSRNDSESDCSINTARISFIYISAIIVLIMSLCRLILEGMQLITQFRRYIKDWVNWIEIALYICSITFVCVFGVDCLCPLNWQWQIGVVAVFLGWMDLIVFISKFPLTGIYVLMFIKILTTFLKMIILSALLVFAFGLTFYLTFTQPEILRSPFSTPGRSLFKTITMTTGEFDLDSIFRQDPAGGSDDVEEIPFPPISYMLWIVFIIIMPILLTNMLVGLAVGDIGAVQAEAELQKLALQVEQVLTVEEFLPRKMRRYFTCGYDFVQPNSLRRKSWQKQILFLLWGGDRYDSRARLEEVIYPHEDKQKDKLFHEVKNLKYYQTSVNDKVMKIQSKNDELLNEVEDLKSGKEMKRQFKGMELNKILKTSVNNETKKVFHKVEDLKTSVDNEIEKIQRKNDEILQEVEHLKTSVDSMKQLLKEIVMKLESSY